MKIFKMNTTAGLTSAYQIVNSTSTDIIFMFSEDTAGTRSYCKIIYVKPFVYEEKYKMI